jgi:hypothetical protein
VKQHTQRSFEIDIALPDCFAQARPIWWKYLMPPTYKNDKFAFSYHIRLQPLHDSVFGDSEMSEPIPIEFV